MIALFLLISLDLHAFEITTRGGDESSFYQRPNKRTPSEELKEKFDVAVIGGGLAGLTATSYLSEAGKKVLLLEKESELGGLATGGVTPEGHHYGRGAAYWAGPYNEESKILDDLGFEGISKTHAITEPIDSYLWNGKLYEKIWEQATLKELPASFEVFYHELKIADKAKQIPNQPIEENVQAALDSMTALKWIQSLPDTLAQRTDPESKRVHARFLADKRIPKKNPMRDVIEFLDVYSRSALGANCDKISAAALMNFYVSEIETRYSSNTGSGTVSTRLAQQLTKRKSTVTIRTGSRVDHI